MYPDKTCKGLSAFDHPFCGDWLELIMDLWREPVVCTLVNWTLNQFKLIRIHMILALTNPLIDLLLLPDLLAFIIDLLWLWNSIAIYLDQQNFILHQFLAHHIQITQIMFLPTTQIVHQIHSIDLRFIDCPKWNRSSKSIRGWGSRNQRGGLGLKKYVDDDLFR